jgi:hypothetical protein
MVAAGSSSLTWAKVWFFGLPNNKRLSQAMVPVSRNPETTTYKIAIVAMPGLDNPANASVGVNISLSKSRHTALSRTVSAGKRLVASMSNEPVKMTETAIRSTEIKIRP